MKKNTAENVMSPIKGKNVSTQRADTPGAVRGAGGGG